MDTSPLYWVYLLELSNGRFYTGMTADVDARLLRHASGFGARTTRFQREFRLVGAAPLGSRRQAGTFERRVKQWSADRKHAFFKAFEFTWSRYGRQVALPPATGEALGFALSEVAKSRRVQLVAQDRVLEIVEGALPALTKTILQAGFDRAQMGEWLCRANKEIATSPAEAIAQGNPMCTLAWVLRSLHLPASNATERQDG